MRQLKLGGILTLIASLIHIAIIVGGADCYRFFGAGENMATMSEQGSIYPTIITSIIACILFIWSLYAFSGAGLIRKLPLLKSVLIIITCIFILRGFLGIPLVIFLDTPHLSELKSQMTFMIISSALCAFIGLLYLTGVYTLYKTRVS